MVKAFVFEGKSVLGVMVVFRLSELPYDEVVVVEPGFPNKSPFILGPSRLYSVGASAIPKFPEPGFPNKSPFILGLSQ